MPQPKVYAPPLQDSGKVKSDPLSSGRIIPTLDCPAESDTAVHDFGPMSHPCESSEYSGYAPRAEKPAAGVEAESSARKLVEGEEYKPGFYPFQKNDVTR